MLMTWYLEDGWVGKEQTLEIIQKLGVSKGLVSIAVNELLDYGLIRCSGSTIYARRTYIACEDIGSIISSILKEREMRENLAAIEATGATLRYHAADVRDAMGMRLVVEMTRQEFGAITGVIHGAGIIEDKLIVDKSAESFNRVFDTKADSLFILQFVIVVLH